MRITRKNNVRVASLAAMAVAVAIGATIERTDAQGQSRYTLKEYRGECTQTVDGKSTVQGACTISVKCDQLDPERWKASFPELVGTDGWVCHLGVSDLPRFDGSRMEGFIKTGEKLAFSKTRAPQRGTGSLTETEVTATVTMQKPTVSGTQTTVLSYKGKFVK
jgi:hypothetical protein